jgi:hypothetical protein
MTVVTGGVRGGFGRSAEETGRRGTGWKVLADAVLLGRDEAGDCGPLEVAVCAGSITTCGGGLWVAIRGYDGPQTGESMLRERTVGANAD